MTFFHFLQNQHGTMLLKAVHVMGAISSVRENVYIFLGWTQQSQKTNTNTQTNVTHYIQKNMIPLSILKKKTEEECLVTLDNTTHSYKHITSKHKLTKDQTNIQRIHNY